jgi:flagellar basal body rod protein FlgC
VNKLFLLFLILCLPTFANQDQQYSVETFCQDLNIILQKVQVHTSNIANHQTTRTHEGGHYKRLIIGDCKDGFCDTYKDESPPQLIYRPEHPDANEEGYVAYPFFSIYEEKSFLLKAQNAYSLVLSQMPVRPIALLKGNKFDQCFKNYKFFKEKFDFQTYLGR